MPPASVNGPLGDPFTILDTVDSTNNYAMRQVHEGLANHGQVYFARHQFAGKGQRGKAWDSEPGSNIIMSLVLDLDFPKMQFPFLLSAATALACFDLLHSFAKNDIKIKWPNDLYWRDRKAGGILIENVVRGAEWKWAIVGVGINVNQEQLLPTAASIKQMTGHVSDPVELAKTLCQLLEARYSALRANGNGVMREYNEHLYGRDKSVQLKKNNVVFETTICNVSVDGRLQTKDRLDRSFAVGEVEWIIR